jgi:hypothetical protein
MDVPPRVYTKCIAGQEAEAKRRILETTQPADTGHGEDKPDGHQDDETLPR